MPDALLYPPSENFFQTTLSAQLADTAGDGDTFSVNDASGLQNKSGICVINRVNTSDEETPAKREVIEYSGVSGSAITIQTRNVDGSGSTLTHEVGSIVEFIPDVTWANRLATAMATLVDEDDISSINTNIATLSDAQTYTAAKTFSAQVAFEDKRTSTVHDNGNSGTSDTIDLSNGETQKSTLTGNCTYTLTNFEEGDYLTLFIDVDGTGSYNQPTISASGVTFYHDDNDIDTSANAKNMVAIRFFSATEARMSTASGLTSTTTL
jgi:hypothetical protein